MAIRLHVGLDLGSDTIKIAYAYENGKSLFYGKVMKADALAQTALPAIAYYDEDAMRWLYADQVQGAGQRSFVNVVKIKSLLSLLLEYEDKDLTERNRRCYLKGHSFPKFYFPVRKKMNCDFTQMIRDEMTFLCLPFTPQEVCQGFFNYVAQFVNERIAALRKELDEDFMPKYEIALVHPSRTGKAYVDELKRLTYDSFHVFPERALSSTKALSMYAYQRGMIKRGESLLVFDMGEQDISVAKASLLSGSRLVVDGADGHNAPMELGGNDLDDAVANYIEDAIYHRETVGSPSFGKQGHILEHGLHAKQYLFMKDVKAAKTILSMRFDGDSMFEDGVPISLSRDLYIQRKLTHAQFVACIGAQTGEGVSRRIADYILEELARPVNVGVKKVLFSGGVIETYRLADFIRDEIAKKYPNAQCLTFDDNKTVADGHTILSYEDSSYAPAVGGAIVSLKNYDVHTVVALSYAIWTRARFNGSLKKVLSIFLDKGETLPEEAVLKFDSWNSGAVSEIRGEEIFSTLLTTEDIKNRAYEKQLPGQFATSDFGSPFFRIGETHEDIYYRRAQAVVGLKSVAGGENAKICFFYRGTPVKLLWDISVAEGVRLDSEGVATPFVKNNEPSGKRVEVEYGGGKRAQVPSDQIEIRFEGVSDKIVIQAND